VSGMTRPGRKRPAFLIAVAWLCAGLSAPAGAQGYAWSLPDWTPRPHIPQDNPMSTAKVELGRHLFYDVRLSADRTISCATCHQQERGFTDGQALSKGINQQFGLRSAMSLANVAYSPVLTWANPSLKSLEIQALLPIFGEHPVEMGMAGKEKILFGRLRQDPVYRQLFAQAFPQEARQGARALYTVSTVTKALASFQRSLLSFNSPFDRYRYGGDATALSPSARRGEALFFGEKLECYHCHGGLNFTDNVGHTRNPFPEIGFHNTGLYNVDGRGAYPPQNKGIAEVTGDPSDMGKFRTPTLRNIEATAPYMHDGSLPDLRSVIRSHYAEAGRSSTTSQGSNPLRSQFIRGFEISEDEIADVIEFLKSLTDTAFLQDPNHANPWAQRTAPKDCPARPCAASAGRGPAGPATSRWPRP